MFLKMFSSHPPCIKMQKGIFQGCLISPYLFLMAIEVLGISIRENDSTKGIKIGDLEEKVNMFFEPIWFNRNKTYFYYPYWYDKGIHCIQDPLCCDRVTEFELGLNYDISIYDLRKYNLLIKGLLYDWIKGCGMGPWLVLFSFCFRENIVVTCKIWSFCVV